MTTKSRIYAACVAFTFAASASTPVSAAWKTSSEHRMRPNMAELFRSDLSMHLRRGRGVPPPSVHDPRLSPKAIKVPRNYPHDPRYGPH